MRQVDLVKRTNRRWLEVAPVALRYETFASPRTERKKKHTLILQSIESQFSNIMDFISIDKTYTFFLNINLTIIFLITLLVFAYLFFC